jgi:signal transduction histidine kinase
MRETDALITVGVVSSGPGDAGPSRRPHHPAYSERQWLASLVLAACAALAMVTAIGAPYSYPHGQRLIFAVVPCGAILLLRRWPVPVLAIVAAVAGLALATGHSSLVIGLMLGVAMYSVALRLPRRVSVPAAAATAAALGGALLFALIGVRDAPVTIEAIEGWAPLLVGFFIGDSVAARRRYLAGLAEQTERERASEAERARHEVREERVRIARELHDVLAHTLTVITVQAGVGRRLMAKRPEQASAALEAIEMIGRTAQDELGVALGLLRDEETRAAALAPAPRLVDVKELADNVRASGTPVELRMSGLDRRLSPALELSVYRVVQEALTNVVRHAPGARATVDLAVSATRIRIEVADDGGTADHPAEGEEQPTVPGTGHGIVGMRERMAAFGGWLVAEPLAGRGFHVVAEVPAEAAM